MDSVHSRNFTIGGSKGDGALGTRGSPLDPISFNFMQILPKILPNNRYSAHTHLGNPVSATGPRQHCNNAAMMQDIALISSNGVALEYGCNPILE